MKNPSSKILIIDDEKKYREVYSTLLTEKGYKTVTAGSASEAFSVLKKTRINLILLDLVLPEVNGVELLKKIKKKYGDTVEVIMVTGYGSIDSAVSAMKYGAFSYFVKSHDPDTLLFEIKKALKMNDLLKDNKVLKSKLERNDYLLESDSKKMEQTIDIARRAAVSNANILVTGESGVGKEILSKFIHNKSDRYNRPFIPVNCASFSENLLESELFGHVKGAFTGATRDRIGCFEEADGGTLFLDEVGEIPLSLQVKLLRVLEEKIISPVGSNKKIQVDFRLISATKQNIKKMISEGNFREDLFYRINTIQLEIPPLRARKEDLDSFISYFFKKFAQETNIKLRKIEPAVKELLSKYDYPGNLRELKNIIERLVVLSPDGVIRKEYLPIEFKKENPQLGQKLDSSSSLKSLKKARKEFEAKYIKNALAKNEGNITQTAKKLDISRRHLTNKVKEYGLK